MTDEGLREAGFLVRNVVPDEVLLTAIAHALHVERRDVVKVSDRIPTEAVVVSWIVRPRGFRLDVSMNVDPASGVRFPDDRTIARAIARELGEDLLTEPAPGDSPFPSDMLLVHPDGSMRVVTLDGDADADNCAVPLDE